MTRGTCITTDRGGECGLRCPHAQLAALFCYNTGFVPNKAFRPPLPPRDRQSRGVSTITLSHARFRHPHPRRPRAQPAGRRPAAAAEPADLLHGGQRLGEEFAGLRHAVCRGAAALRAEPVQFRPAVPRPDAQARRGPDLRPEPGDLDLAEDRRAEPAIHRRHDHRDLRLPAGAVSPGWARGTARSAAGRSPPRPASRSSSGFWPCRPARGFWCWPR